MMAGYFAALAAQALAETEARLQAEEAARRAAEAQRQFDLLRQQHEALHGVVIDVEAREVPDVQALPAPDKETDDLHSNFRMVEQGDAEL